MHFFFILFQFCETNQESKHESDSMASPPLVSAIPQAAASGDVHNYSDDRPMSALDPSTEPPGAPFFPTPDPRAA